MMTNKEAVEKLRENFCKLKLFCELYPDACQKEDCDIYLAIEVLKGKDTVSPSIDTISRQAAIDAIEKAKTAKSEDGEIYVAKYNAEMNITLLPSAQPDFDIDQKINKAYDDGYDQGYLQCKADKEPIIGHWIERQKKGSCRWQSWCSVCGKHSGIGGIKSNRHKPFCPNCGSRMSGEVEWEI